MKKESPEQQKIIHMTMHEFKQGKLKSGNGKKVENPRQAIAIGLKEAGASQSESPSKNSRNLKYTRRKINSGQKR